MVWNILTSQGFESFKIFHLIPQYCRGIGLDIGCGPQKCLPHMIGVDAEPQNQATIKAAADEIDMFGDGALDFIFSSHLLEHIPREEVLGVLNLWGRKIREGGHLVLYLPSANLYPKVGEPGANTDHKWNVCPGDVEEILASEGEHFWTQVECEERDQGDEYSLFEVYRKDTSIPLHFKQRVWDRNPDGKKRALVSRFGGIGDILTANPALHSLSRDEYHVTFNTESIGEEIFRHHPLVDDFIVQDKDQIPEDWLAEYFWRLEERYDKVIDLNNSVEGLTLMRPEQLPYSYPEEARRSLFSHVNYEETVARISGVTWPPEGSITPSFVASEEEQEWALQAKSKMPGQCVVWGIAGSSINKIYPWVNVVAGWLAEKEVSVIFTGGGHAALQLEEAVITTMYEDRADMSYIYPRVDKWSLRESMTVATHLADVVVGPETGIMHAVAYAGVPKVVYLSHSTHENLTKHWPSTTVLVPSQDDCPCYPCHMIHETWETCTKDEQTNVALCSSSISPTSVYDAIMDFLK